MSAKERPGTNGCTGSSLSPHSEHCCVAFHLPAHAGVGVYVSLPALSISGSASVPWISSTKGSSKAQVCSHRAVCFAVSHPQSLHLHLRKSSLCREVRLSPPPAWAFPQVTSPSGHKFRLSPRPSVCPAACCTASTSNHKFINHKSTCA